MEHKLLPDTTKFLLPYHCNDYIRLGRNFDGGYITSRKILGQSTELLSFGIGNDWSFESDYNKYKPFDPISAFDKSVDTNLWDEDLQNKFKNFFIDNKVFNYANVGMNGDEIGLDSILQNRKKVFIKMDIEGNEYRLIDSITKFADTITGIVVEFHQTDKLRHAFTGAVKRLSKHFKIIHMHPNTSCGYAHDNFPRLVELSFVHKHLHDNITQRYNCYLENLDKPNAMSDTDVNLFWNQ